MNSSPHDLGLPSTGQLEKYYPLQSFYSLYLSQGQLALWGAELSAWAEVWLCGQQALSRFTSPGGLGVSVSSVFDKWLHCRCF